MAQTVQKNSVDEDNKRFVPDEVWETVEEVEETLEFLISQYGSFEGPLVYPIIVKENNDNVGYVQLVPIEDGKWEIGYHIAKRCTGNGYATEALRAFLPVIAKAANLTEIYGICLAENNASCAVMIKCGFTNVYSGMGLYQGTDREIIKNVWKL
ncbi:MAG: GNAT family N-acetyltransferase [Bacteroidales bacterium]|nr:GNAT family N-acetyltransferase [Bacteroidales bacterium]